jgi:purine-binding chemotaxis protein CheW
MFGNPRAFTTGVDVNGGNRQQVARIAGVRKMTIGSPDFILPGLGVDQGPEFQELETPEGELHLRFYVPSGNEFALPATGIREVLSPSPDRMTPIPNVSSLLLGTLNMRGRVIWVADLGQFLGDQTPLNTDRPEIPIIAVEDQDTILGLAVDRIVGMHWLDVEQLHSQNNAPDGMIPFLRGEWMLGEQANQVLRLLDQVKILRSARWAA